MPRPGRRTIASSAIAAGLAAAGWELARRRDRSAIESDPEKAVFVSPQGGRAQTVVSDDGTELHVEIFGDEDAPTIVLAHGWTCAIRFWTRQIQSLQGEYRVVAYDQRGHGRSGHAVDGYAIERFAADLHTVLEACVADGERAVVAGHSLGGMSIVAWAGLHVADVTEKVAAAALVNTGMNDLIVSSLVVPMPTAFGRVAQVIGSAALAAPVPLPKGPTPLAHRLVRYVALSKSATPAQVAFSEDLVLNCRPDVRGAVGATLSRINLHTALQRLTVPTLVIAGGADKLTPLPLAERMQEELPAAVEPMLVLDGVGHMGPIEAADDVTAALRELLSEHLAGRSKAINGAHA